MERQLYSRRGFLEIFGQMAAAALFPNPDRFLPQTPLIPLGCRFKTGILGDLEVGFQPRQADIRAAMLPEIDNIRRYSSISGFGREKLEAIITAVTEMDRNGNLRWFVVDIDETPGFVPDIALPGTECTKNPNASILLAGASTGLANVLNSSVHEMYHAYRFYTRYKQNLSCIYSLGEKYDEERNAQYFGDLVESVAAYEFGYYDGFKEDRFINSHGSKNPLIVRYLDQNNFKPDDPLNRNIYDMQQRYADKLGLQILLKGGRKAEYEKAIQFLEANIKTIEDRWREFPLTEQKDLAMVEEIKQNGWVKPGFFLN